ncbi:MAG: hypothetical protein FWB87_15070 [Defluviitaleaceae bacterium]|nr:hypothetical protein [Defluviitaleaceae bacterium]
MPQQLISETQVKNALQIDSFRNITKSRIMEFASLIPNMDKDVAMAIINQFPAYASAATDMVVQFKEMCDSALKDNKESSKEAIEAYRKILDDLGELLKKDEISPEERASITENMIAIADKISAKDTENKEFLDKVIKHCAHIVTAALILGSVILGVNAKGAKIPFLKK